MRLFLSIFTSPRLVFQEHLDSVPAPICLLVSGLAFSLFYFQTGLDLARTGSGSAVGALGLGTLGLIVGSGGVGLLALLAWLLARPYAGNQSLGWTVRAFALSYSPALIYGGLGLMANLLFGWNTSLAFGVTGVLWALGPMLVAIREMTEQRTGLSAIIATACGALMLVVWALIVG